MNSEGPEPADREPFWRCWVVGDRVVVRYRLADEGTGDASASASAGGSRGGDAGPSLTDALGEVLAIDDDGVTVRTRRGDVAVPASAITLGKRVPPPPPRRTGPTPRPEPDGRD